MGTTRALAVLGIVASVVLVAGVASAAIQGDDGTVKGCVKAGTIRVIDQADTCKENEVLVSFLSGTVTTAMIQDGTIVGDDLSQALVDELTSASSVNWSQILGVPSDLADGDDDGSAAMNDLAALLSGEGTGDVTVNESTDPVSWYRLTGVPGEITDGDDVDGGTAADLDCNFCLTSTDLASGAVGKDALQNGAVTTDEQTANAAASEGGAPATVYVDSGQPTPDYVAAGATIVPSEPGGFGQHAVLLTGQFRATCVSPCLLPGDHVDVEWQVMANGLAVSPTYTDALSPTDTSLVGSVSVLDHGFSQQSKKTYTLRVRLAPSSDAAGYVTIDQGALNAVDLGRS